KVNESARILAGLRRVEKIVEKKAKPRDSRGQTDQPLLAPCKAPLSYTGFSPIESASSQPTSQSLTSSVLTSSDLTTGESSLMEDLWLTSESEDIPTSSSTSYRLSGSKVRNRRKLGS